MTMAELLGVRWAEYERRKRRLQCLGLPAAEYQMLVRKIALELKL